MNCCANKSVDNFRLSLGSMIDSEAICKLAEEGDEIAQEAFSRTGWILGIPPGEFRLLYKT
jgi:hypothetical protein